VHDHDVPTSALYSALAPILAALIEGGVLPEQDIEYAVLVWITLFDERVIVDLRTAKGWSSRHIARQLGATVLSALGAR
jgi:hypothetical protein